MVARKEFIHRSTVGETIAFPRLGEAQSKVIVSSVADAQVVAIQDFKITHEKINNLAYF